MTRPRLRHVDPQEPAVSGVTPDTAARQNTYRRNLAMEILDGEDNSVEIGTRAARELIEACGEIEALLSELATARQERDQAYRINAELLKHRDGYAAELVVVRRQLAEAREALREIAKDANVLPFAPGFQTLKPISARARAVLDAGQEVKP